MKLVVGEGHKLVPALVDISVEEIRRRGFVTRISEMAMCDKRTVRRALKGEEMRPLVGKRIAQAMADLGIRISGRAS